MHKTHWESPRVRNAIEMNMIKTTSLTVVTEKNQCRWRLVYLKNPKTVHCDSPTTGNVVTVHFLPYTS